MNRRIRFLFKDLNLYKVKSDNLSMYFFDKMRGFNVMLMELKKSNIISYYIQFKFNKIF